MSLFFFFFADRGTRYEFRLSGRNSLGWGQEFVTYLDTPEGGIVLLKCLNILPSILKNNSIYKC